MLTFWSLGCLRNDPRRDSGSVVERKAVEEAQSLCFERKVPSECLVCLSLQCQEQQCIC